MKKVIIMDPWLSLVRNSIVCTQFGFINHTGDNMALWLTRARSFHIYNMFCPMLVLSQFIMQPLSIQLRSQMHKQVCNTFLTALQMPVHMKRGMCCMVEQLCLHEHWTSLATPLDPALYSLQLISLQTGLISRRGTALRKLTKIWVPFYGGKKQNASDGVSRFNRNLETSKVHR